MSAQLDQLRSEIANGMSQSDAIEAMHRRGFSIIEAIKAVRELFSISLGRAKPFVALHPAYREVALANEPLHDEIERAFGLDL